jgi:tetratricopeptide (TPR) repeat protein
MARASPATWSAPFARCGADGAHRSAGVHRKAPAGDESRFLRSSKGKLSVTQRPGQAHAAAEALVARGNALEDKGQVTAALEVYRTAWSTAPDFVRAPLNVGNALRTLGRADEAEAELQRALHRKLACWSSISGTWKTAADCRIGSRDTASIPHGSFFEVRKIWAPTSTP